MKQKKFDREACVALLREKYDLLLRDGVRRYPRRSDFDEDEAAAVKAMLGPWPRALEAAGIKPERDKRTERNLEKHIRARRRRREIKQMKKDGAKE